MPIQDKLDIEVCFNLNNPVKRIEVTDNTDYASEGIALADVVGILTIVSPLGGIVYQNIVFGTPDIDLDVSTVFADDAAAIPLDGLGNVIIGSYSVQYTIRVVGAVQPGDYVLTKAQNYAHTLPEACLELTVDCGTTSITSDDQTNYNEFAVAETITRTHTLHPPVNAENPVGTPLTPTVDVTKEIVASPISTKTWTAEISSVVKFVYASDGTCVLDTVTGTKEVEVICDVNLCDIFCCIDALYSRYRSELGSNPIKANETKRQWDLVLANVVLFEHARTCGDSSRANALYNEILSIGNCKPGCSCDAVNPIPVIPITIIQGPQGDPGIPGPQGLPGVPGVVFEYYDNQTLGVPQVWVVGEAVIAGMTRVVGGASGNYVVQGNLLNRYDNSTSGEFRLYVDAVLVYKRPLSQVGVTTVDQIDSFVWRGNINNGQTVEVRVIDLVPGPKIETHAFDWLITQQ